MIANQLETEKSAFTAKRLIRLPSMNSRRDEDNVRGRISSLKGVYRVVMNLPRKQILVIYNTARIDFSAITVVLFDAGYPMENSRWIRFKALWYQYLDDNARANAQLPSTDCCSNPRSIYAKKHK